MSVPDRESTMKLWDFWRKKISDGDTGSYPQDWFESELDSRDEQIVDLEEALDAAKFEIKRLCNGEAD